MSSIDEGKKTLVSHHVWDKSVRIFHWLNFICIISLMFLGLAILNYKSFGVDAEGKILLKTIHAYIGYVFVLNLLFRLLWAFIGGKFSRWKAFLPFGKNYSSSLKAYIKGIISKDSPEYAGHNPLARLMVSFLLVLLSAQAVTGLVLAGTDLYLPPFGHEIAEWVMGSGEDHSKLENFVPGSKEGVDPKAYQAMRDFRKPFITIHLYGFYTLGLSIVLHIIGVIVTEVRERNGLVSAMFTGSKVFSKPPVDMDENEPQN